MEGNRVAKASALLAAAALVASAATANAQVSAADYGCRATVQKNSGKLGATAGKTIDGCIKSVLGGKIGPGTDCNNLAAADVKGKVLAAAAKVAPGNAKKCLTLPTNLVGTNCPSPANLDDGGDGVSDVTELSACQVSLNTKTIESLRNYILRPNVAAILAYSDATAQKNMIKCANAIGKNATKLWSTVAKERGKCMKASDKAAGPYDYSVCSSADPKGKIASTVAKLQAGVQKACGDTLLKQGELALIGSCASSVAGINGCVVNAVKKNANGATAMAYEFPGVCPSTVRVVVNGGGKNKERSSSTRLDAGWTGLGHDQDVVDGFTGRVNLSCSSDDCSSCSVTASCAEGNCRCRQSPQILCNTPFAAGGACGADTCVVMFGPPLPLSAGNAPTCVVNTIEQAFTGTADVGRGTSNTPIKNIARVYTGIGQTQPCPTCSGTTIGGGGTCNGGARNGQACTTNAINTTYGNTSYDCPPTGGANISGSGLKIDLTLTDGPVSLSAGDQCDSPYGAFGCPCGGCSLDPTVACKVDTDCSGVGLGTCSNAGGEVRKPNACTDLTCNSTGVAGIGTCNAGPVDTFCDGNVRPNGTPYLQCNVDGDCGALGAGTCNATLQRPCYLNPITASGVPGTDGANLVSTFCSGPTTSGGVNAATGAPGPGRITLDFDYTGLCSNGTTEYELGGHNCP